MLHHGHVTTTRSAALRAVAAFYGGTAAVAAIRPALVPAIFGGTASTAESRTEIRAVYAGIPLAFAAALIQAERGGPISAGLVAVVRNASYAMGGTRLFAALVERRVAPWPTGVFAALELGAAAALDPRFTSRGADPGNP